MHNNRDREISHTTTLYGIVVYTRSGCMLLSCWPLISSSVLLFNIDSGTLYSLKYLTLKSVVWLVVAFVIC